MVDTTKNLGGAPRGNKNATKTKVWTAAIERALAKRSRVDAKEALDNLAEKLLIACDEGNLTALQELGNRLEGKPAQAMTITDPNGEPVITRVMLVTPNADSKD